MTDRTVSSPQARMAIGDMAVKSYGKYFLVRKLAEGGMAEIFLAKAVGVEGFEKNVVIKRMLPHLSTAPDFVSMFLDEARLAASLNHPNIVQISDLGLADGCYFICMEYLAGEDFSTVLRTSKRRGEPTPLNITLRVISEAAVGLHFAHEAVDQKGQPINLVHRDISPSNLFITYSGQVKVLDFGIAKAESRVTTTGTGVVKGKYQYMSPEQARGDNIDRRADVFSLGVSLYEAVTGIRPFARDTDLAVLKAVLDGEYQPVKALRPDLPLEVEQIINRAMAQEPEYRYPTAMAMAQDIEKYMGATTSASGGQALVNFMRGFFGEERVRSKTRIESLDELSARGVDVPGKVNPLSPKTDPGLVQPPKQDPTRVVAPAGLTTDPAGPPSRSWAPIVAVLVLSIAAAIGGTMYVMRPPPAAVVVDAGVVEVALPPAVVDAGPAAVEPPDAGLDAGDAGAPALVDAGIASTRPQRPPVLTVGAIARHINALKPRLQKCFRDHESELPSPRGKMLVEMVIEASGRFTNIKTGMDDKKVGACVAGVFRSSPMGPHADRAGVSFRQTLDWGS